MIMRWLRCEVYYQPIDNRSGIAQYNSKCQKIGQSLSDGRLMVYRRIDDHVSNNQRCICVVIEN